MKDSKLTLRSSDEQLVKGFNWAKEQALAYSHEGDPVGSWYEAALPKRAAFCMRDISHQSTGGHALGLIEHNENMLYKFASNIHKDRDYCTFWEIDKWDRPAQVDYTSDEDFWYNLPANFDLIDCIYRQFHWTGNREYFEDEVYKTFFDLTFKNYTDTWDLNGDGILEGQPSNGRRGIASYEEARRGIRVGADLIAAHHRALVDYAELLEYYGKDSTIYREKSEMLYNHFSDAWWDEERQRYIDFLLHDGTFFREYKTFHLPLYFGLIKPGPRADIMLDMIEDNVQHYNVESLSYVSEILYRYGRKKAGYDFLLRIMDENLDRREYPEVSYSTITSIVVGLMGMKPNAFDNKLETMSAILHEKDWVELSNVPVFDGMVTIKHEGTRKSTLTNHGDKPLVWRASFEGEGHKLSVVGKTHTSIPTTLNEDGIKRTFVDIKVEAGETVTVTS